MRDMFCQVHGIGKLFIDTSNVININVLV